MTTDTPSRKQRASWLVVLHRLVRFQRSTKPTAEGADIRFWVLYVKHLPDKIWWFMLKAPMRCCPDFFASVHRMTWNGALLELICERADGSWEKHCALTEAEQWLAAQRSGSSAPLESNDAR